MNLYLLTKTIMSNLIQKVIKVVLDAMSPYPKGWDSEFSEEKYQASGGCTVYGLDRLTIINKATGEKSYTSLKQRYGDGGVYDTEYWLQSADWKKSKTIVYLDDIILLSKSGKYQILGARWYYGDVDKK